MLNNCFGLLTAVVHATAVFTLVIVRLVGFVVFA